MKYKYYPVSKRRIEKLFEETDKDNANIGYNPEAINKYILDDVMKAYALDKMPTEAKELYEKGIVHHHDLEYCMLRPNCMNYDIRFFARNGLRIDGIGDMGSVAKPANNLEVILNHLLQALMAGSICFSGGQGFANFNTFLAPYCRDRDYYEIKQAIQGFIFNCNMSLVGKSGQVIFSSIGVDLSIPDILKNEPAISLGGVANGVYGDYEKEFNLLFKAICEVINEKDATGNYHRFPNVLFNIRKGDLDKYEGNCRLLHELGANNPTIYYNNCTQLERTTMGALSYDTPVMTDKGFKYPFELMRGDQVMTYRGDGSKEWKLIKQVIPKIAKGKMFKITLDNNYEFKVTENHKLPTNRGIIKSEDLKIGDELYNYIDDYYEPIEDYKSQLIGVFLADGHIKSQKNGNPKSSIEFHIKQEWKLQEIINICEKLGLVYDINYRKDNTMSLFIRDKNLRNEFFNLYDNERNKQFPKDVWHDKNIISNIIKGLMFDAHKQGKNSFVWSCSNKGLVIDVLNALSYIGRKTTLYVDNRNGWKTNYRVTFGSKNFKPINTTKIKSIEMVNNKVNVYDLSIEDNHNYVCGIGGIHSQNCRTSLPMNYTGKYDEDCLNTGNFMYSTINLPLIALETPNANYFYKKLEEVCESIYEFLHWRRETVRKIIYENKISTFLLWEDVETGKPLYNFDTTSMSIGFCGLYECLKANNELDGESILQFLNKKKDEFNERDGLRWSVFATPAESTAFKFGKMIHEKYPEFELNGGARPYLTNSTHIPVNQESNIIDHIRNADKYHKYTGAGNILHIWLGEVWSNPKSLWKLNQKIINTNTIFWAYSKVFSWCKTCGWTINDNIKECQMCGEKEDILVYDRITGYYLPIKTWNDGKLSEFKDRYRQGGLGDE